MKFPPIILSIFITLSSAQAAIELPAVFSEGAIFQRDQNLPVWGWGQSGEPVSVHFAGQTETTTVAADGSWRVTFKPVAASYDTHTMDITVGSESRKIEDLLVGEVWLCTGQSNMQYTFEAIAGRSKDKGFQSVIRFMVKERDTARDEFLRMITVPTATSLEEGTRTFEGKWDEVAPENNGNFSCTAYFFGKEIRKHVDCPVGFLVSAYGGQRIDGFIPPSAWKASPEKAQYEDKVLAVKKEIRDYDADKARGDHEQAHAEWKKNSGKAREEPKLYNPSITPSSFPGAIYNGMIHPLAPYAIRGALWYQGESHSRSNPQAYGSLLEMLFTGLRTEWGQGEFPIYYCQLAGFMEPVSEPLQETPSIVVICNQQRLAMKIPNTGMAVLNDVGQAKDYHPKNKFDVGLRLSKWALNKTYGFTEIVPSGPLYRSSEITGSSIVVNFDYPGSGLMVGKKELMEPVITVNAPLGGFEICGEDMQWMLATAKIVGDDTVEVSNESIQTPFAVRYAWQGNPTNANLYNKEGLPASLFSTTDLTK